MPDTIEIRRLEVQTHIGVPDEERANEQSLWITVRLIPSQGFDHLNDSIEHTIDYQSVADQLVLLAGEKPRKLIETLEQFIGGIRNTQKPLWNIPPLNHRTRTPSTAIDDLFIG